MSATTNLGKVSVTPKGAWAITNTYEILDIVTSGGSSYLAKQDVPTGVPLSNTSYWIMIAEKGDGGEVTSASASISGGYGTPGVIVTAGGTAHERTLAFAFTNLRGEKGETGNGIDSVYKTGTSGLVDTYTILFTDGSTYEFEVNNGTASIDDTLTKSGWAADAKAVGDTKASIDGFYETMGVGVADNLTPYSEDSGATQDIPFIAQGTGCGNGESVVDTGSYLQFKKKLGNTVGVNQLADVSSFVDNAQWETETIVTSGNKCTITFSGNETSRMWIQAIQNSDNRPSLVIGHMYLAFVSFSIYNGSLSGQSVYYRIGGTGPGTYQTVVLGGTPVPVIFTSTIDNELRQIAIYNSGASTITSSTKIECSVYLIDLTVWYGSNDRIPSDLLSHPENWGRYYAGSLAYAAGYLDSADGTVLTSISRNLLDPTKFSNNYTLAWSGGGLYAESKSVVTDYIPVIPNAEYATNYYAHFFAYDENKNYIGNWLASGSSGSWIKTSGSCLKQIKPSGCSFIRAAYRTSINGDEDMTTKDICLSLYYSGESGYDQYYPYSVLAEVDTGSEVLRSAGAVADEKTPDGTITRRVGVVDLGTLNWTFIGDADWNCFYVGVTGRKPGKVMMSSKYALNTVYGTANDKALDGNANNTNVYIRDNSFSGDAAAFKTAMSGIYLYYELATPTTEQGTAFAENIPCDDFGSMYWTQTKGIPQGNEIFYPVDYKASIDTLYNRVEGDMSKIVIDSELGAVADRIPAAPDTDGTYTLKATVSSGTKTYSWVADE